MTAQEAREAVREVLRELGQVRSAGDHSALDGAREKAISKLTKIAMDLADQINPEGRAGLTPPRGGAGLVPPA